MYIPRVNKNKRRCIYLAWVFTVFRYTTARFQHYYGEALLCSFARERQNKFDSEGKKNKTKKTTRTKVYLFDFRDERKTQDLAMQQRKGVFRLSNKEKRISCHMYYRVFHTRKTMNIVSTFTCLCVITRELNYIKLFIIYRLKARGERERERVRDNV